MKFLNIEIIVYILGGVGLILIFFSKHIFNLINRFYNLCNIFPLSHIFYKSLSVWALRIIGLILLIFIFMYARSGPSMKVLKKDENRIELLKNGLIVKGKIIRVFYQLLASGGWKVIYEFYVENPLNHEKKKYYGSTQGPKKYYSSLSKGESIEVIYSPLNPNINCEIKCFLNHPSFRYSFNRNNKLKLLDKFKNKYEIEEISFKEWYELQRQR